MASFWGLADIIPNIIVAHVSVLIDQALILIDHFFFSITILFRIHAGSFFLGILLLFSLSLLLLWLDYVGFNFLFLLLQVLILELVGHA